MQQLLKYLGKTKKKKKYRVLREFNRYLKVLFGVGIQMNVKKKIQGTLLQNYLKSLYFTDYFMIEN